MADGSIRIKLELEKSDFERKLKRALDLSEGSFKELNLSDLISSDDIEDVFQALKKIEEEIDKTKDDIAQIKAQGGKTGYLEIEKKKAEELAKNIRSIILEKGKLSDADDEIAKKDDANAKKSTNNHKSLIGSIKRWGLALLGIRSTYSLLSKGVHSFLANNKYYANQLQGIWNAFGEMLSPAIEGLIKWLVKGVAIINAFIKALTGVDIVAKANAKSLAKQNKQLASFDEMNKLSDSNGTSGILDLPELDGELQEKIQKLADAVKPFLKFVTDHLGDILIVIGAISTAIFLLHHPIALAIGLIASLVLYFSFDKWRGIGEDMKEGLWEGLKNMWERVKQAFVNVWNGVKEFFGIHSPSTKFEEIGKYMVDGLFNGLKGLWDKIKTIFSTLWANIKSGAITGMDGVKTAIKGKINDIIGWVESAINKIISGINSFINKMNNGKILGTINTILGKNLSVATIGNVALPRLAQGGIVMRPTQAIIGEAGREAVLPLENNTGWMDKLAEKINQSSIIYVQLDGKTIAKQINKANNKLSFLTNGG